MAPTRKATRKSKPTVKPIVAKAKAKVKRKPKLKDWKFIMSHYPKGYYPPKRFSIHALAALTKRNPLLLLEEMKKSKEVKGFFCGTVGTPVFYLNPFGFSGGTTTVWADAKKALDKYPYPEVKGFARYSQARLKTPFGEGEAYYEKSLLDAMKKAGYR